ncbi:hypothetical protein P3X46_002001 [Hevea brasiliensis]|uniref:Uncharacterized protein n=1 Tax=Hevea brasiliensis TaxID=3981 RepID=A0ABQ9N528_HEVBR|nr:uncharacterized protein LOC110673804 isoform X1 [Hevea brasiliensis]KAJ9186428.1 hypothetical protein P3X46_002001 [Hevea brasiliensis]
MSRCFPYPPPRFLRIGERCESVSESIKLQRDKGKAISEHDKKKRKEKKGRKKNRKEEKGACYGEVTYKQLDKRLPPKGKEEEGERSDLTEEHDQPVCSQNLTSSDSTRSSNKRKRDNSAYNGTKSRNLVLRIQLPMQKQRDPYASAIGEQLCSTSGRSDTLLQQKEDTQIPGKEQYSGISSETSTDLKGQENSAGHCVKTTSGMLSHGTKEVQTVESLFKFIEDWVPPGLEFEQTNFDNEEWLFETTRQETNPSKRIKFHLDEPFIESSTLWPSACYLPEAGVYALPYAVPF